MKSTSYYETALATFMSSFIGFTVYHHILLARVESFSYTHQVTKEKFGTQATPRWLTSIGPRHVAIPKVIETVRYFLRNKTLPSSAEKRKRKRDEVVPEDVQEHVKHLEGAVKELKSLVVSRMTNARAEIRRRLMQEFMFLICHVQDYF